ncbi:MAG: calcium/sodium antiporter [Phycisphaerales bacterium]|nr:MAG: calcium/sodium antiporter [Phycisphaerales bacterium]
MLYILFVIGFVLLIKGADLLVDGGSALGRSLGVSDLVIGLTVVAFGTSMPELFVNLIASIQGNTEIAVGNVLGSNICNIFLILGIASIVYPLQVTVGTVWKEIPFSLLAVLVLAVIVNDPLIDRAASMILSRADGLVLLAFFVIFLYYSASIARQAPELLGQAKAKQVGVGRAFFFVAAGTVALALGGKWCVDAAVQVATRLGVSESLIGLTIVAVGTSLPELATSVVAAFKKNSDIAVGNVVGSNIFNILFVLGVSALIKPLPLKPKSNFDILVALAAAIALFLCMFTGRRRTLDRWEGFLMALAYCIYMALLLRRG